MVPAVSPELLAQLDSEPIQLLGPDRFKLGIAKHLSHLDHGDRANRRDSCARCGKALACASSHYFRRVFRCNLRFCDNCADYIADDLYATYGETLRQLAEQAPPGAKFTYIEATVPVAMDLSTRTSIDASRQILRDTMQRIKPALAKAVVGSPTWIYIVGYWDGSIHIRVATLATLLSSPWPPSHDIVVSMESFPMYRLPRYFREKLLRVWLPYDPKDQAAHEVLFIRVWRLTTMNVRNLYLLDEEGDNQDSSGEGELPVEGDSSSTTNSPSTSSPFPHSHLPTCPICGGAAVRETNWMPLLDIPDDEDALAALVWRDISPPKS